MFGVEQYGVQPDIVSIAKGITSGYVPLGAVGVTRRHLRADGRARPDVHARLHLLRPSGRLRGRRCANIQMIEDENLPGNAAARGDQLLDGLQETSPDHPHVGNVRGKGLMVFVEVVADKGAEAGLRGVGGRHRRQAAGRPRAGAASSPAATTPASPSPRRSSSRRRRSIGWSTRSASRSARCSGGNDPRFRRRGPPGPRRRSAQLLVRELVWYDLHKHHKRSARIER